MKRRLNILCMLVFLVLAISLYSTGYQFGLGIFTGMNLAKNECKDLKKSESSMFLEGYLRIVSVVPAAAMWNPDSIINAKSGLKAPVAYTEMAVQVTKDRNYTLLIINSSCALLNIFTKISALIIFVLIIMNINKSQIFEWRNVHRLRLLGTLLIISFVLDILPKIVNYWGLKDIFAIDKYVLAPLAIQVTDVLLGLGCLIVAETFAIGLKIKEEQDLTI